MTNFNTCHYKGVDNVMTKLFSKALAIYFLGCYSTIEHNPQTW